MKSTVAILGLAATALAAPATKKWWPSGNDLSSIDWSRYSSTDIAAALSVALGINVSADNMGDFIGILRNAHGPATTVSDGSDTAWPVPAKSPVGQQGTQTLDPAAAALASAIAASEATPIAKREADGLGLGIGLSAAVEAGLDLDSDNDRLNGYRDNGNDQTNQDGSGLGGHGWNEGILGAPAAAVASASKRDGQWRDNDADIGLGLGVAVAVAADLDDIDAKRV